MLRPATPDDTPTLLALAADTGFFKPVEIEALAAVLGDYYAEYHTRSHRAVVWEVDGRILGFMYYALEEMTEHTWVLYWIVVAPDQQGRGLGSKLLAFVEDDIRERGARLLIIETCTLPHYEPTRRFYLNRGYRLVAEIPDFYAEGDSKVVFTKRL